MARHRKRKNRKRIHVTRGRKRNRYGRFVKSRRKGRKRATSHRRKGRKRATSHRRKGHKRATSHRRKGRKRATSHRRWKGRKRATSHRRKRRGISARRLKQIEKQYRSTLHNIGYAKDAEARAHREAVQTKHRAEYLARLRTKLAERKAMPLP